METQRIPKIGKQPSDLFYEGNLVRVYFGSHFSIEILHLLHNTPCLNLSMKMMSE